MEKKNANANDTPTMNMIDISEGKFGIKISSPDGFNESKTKPWALPPEMLKPGGPSPLTHKIVPEDKRNS